MANLSFKRENDIAKERCKTNSPGKKNSIVGSIFPKYLKKTWRLCGDIENR